MNKQTTGLLTFVAVLAALAISCQKKPETLAEAYKDHFEIGAAVTTGAFQSRPFTKMYKEEVLKNFNLFVDENGMKPEAIYSWAGPESYNFKYGDYLADYCGTNGASMRAHCLIWHDQTPKALMKNGEGIEASRASMKEYIEAYMGHYRGKVQYWDVVNEAISNDWNSLYRTNSGWYEAYGGPEFITDAFTFARATDPDAKLYLVDYNICESGKRERTVEILEELGLVEKGIIDGIGIQAHWNLVWPSVEEIEATILTFGEMGLDVQFTELDIDCYNSDPSAPEMEYTPELEQQLADRYAEIFACFRKNSQYISSVTFWGVADDHTWLHKISGGVWLSRPRTNYPLLFDMKGAPKKAYFAVKDFRE